MNNSNQKFFSKAQLFQFFITFLLTTFGVLTAYYTTIAGIKLDLARKAESQIVNELDKRLSNIELLLKENFMTKKEFFELKDQINQRLLKIELRIEDKNYRGGTSPP
ncbi:MAG: hypothetical protein OEV55_03465 [candidate division Zixibacteria bacterium]|nr:hypothetical protein [candidate division Zixibacteria bacterium]